MGKKTIASRHRTIQERTPDPEEYGPGDTGWTPFARFLLLFLLFAVIILVAWVVVR